MKRLLCILLFLCLVCPAENAVAADMEVLDFESIVRIDTEDRISVTEKITVHIPLSNVNRGIYRDIPINSRWPHRGRQNVQLDITGVSINGKTHPLNDTLLEWPFLRIFMRDKNAYLPAGEHVFLLHYDMNQQIGFFETQDELTWNVTGAGWNGIRQARCIVVLPPDASVMDDCAWVGFIGSQESPVSVERTVWEGRQALVFTSQRALDSEEDFTVAVAWPKGIVTPPLPFEPAEEIWFTGSLLALLLTVCAFGGFIWFRYGKDPASGPIIPLFYPPLLPPRLQKTKTMLFDFLPQP